jgi:hypothetical protein
VAIGILIGGMHGRRLAAIEKAAEAASAGPMPLDLARRIPEPGWWISMTVMNGVAFGIVWLMVTKPAWAGAVVALLAAGLLGAVIGVVIVRAARRTPHSAMGVAEGR